MGEPKQKFTVGGVESVLEMLRVMDQASREKLIAMVEKQDSKLAMELRARIYVFADLVHFSPKEMQTILRAIHMDELALALKTADPTLTDFIYRNLSGRMAEDLRSTLQSMGPKLLKDVEKAQEKILEKVKALAAEGKVVLRKSAKDEMV